MIQTSVLTYDELKPLNWDSRGVYIQTGSKIAYNKSGSVVLGHVQSVNKNEWIAAREGIQGLKWWNHKFSMTVQSEHNSISVLKNINSFIIIK